jgi:hypothetical protein
MLTASPEASVHAPAVAFHDHRHPGRGLQAALALGLRVRRHPRRHEADPPGDRGHGGGAAGAFERFRTIPKTGERKAATQLAGCAAVLLASD